MCNFAYVRLHRIFTDIDLDAFHRDYFVTNKSACTTPGRNRSSVKTILITRSFPKPLFKKTAMGGRNIASTIRTILFIYGLEIRLIGSCINNAILYKAPLLPRAIAEEVFFAHNAPHQRPSSAGSGCMRLILIEPSPLV